MIERAWEKKLEPLTVRVATGVRIRVATAVALTGLADQKIRKLIGTGELKTVRIGRSVLINYWSFKHFCAGHRQNEIETNEVVRLHRPPFGGCSK